MAPEEQHHSFEVCEAFRFFVGSAALVVLIVFQTSVLELVMENIVLKTKSTMVPT